MPPLKGIDRGINGDMLKALEETGHGDQIVVVDASYSIPNSAHKVDYQGDSSVRALLGILDLVPVDETTEGGFGVPTPALMIAAMMPDLPTKTSPALEEFQEAFPLGDQGRVLVGITRLGDEASKGELGKAGFYKVANDPEKRTLFVRTRDQKAYACALFVVGHSQE